MTYDEFRKARGMIDREPRKPEQPKAESPVETPAEPRRGRPPKGSTADTPDLVTGSSAGKPDEV